MDTEECPYCNTDIEINHDDNYGIVPGVRYEDTCSKCGKTFDYEVDYIQIHYMYKKE